MEDYIKKHQRCDLQQEANLRETEKGTLLGFPASTALLYQDLTRPSGNQILPLYLWSLCRDAAIIPSYGVQHDGAQGCSPKAFGTGLCRMQRNESACCTSPHNLHFIPPEIQQHSHDRNIFKSMGKWLKFEIIRSESPRGGQHLICLTIPL